MGEERKLYRVLVEKPKGKRPLGRLMRRWKDGIRMDFGRWAEVLWGRFSWLRIGTGGALF
jgi:hypothetical protein